MNKGPKTLQDAVIHFASLENCHEFMVKMRWPDGKAICPRCGGADVAYLPNAKVFKCYSKHPKGLPQKFSLKVGTIFEDSPIGFDKWPPVMWMLVNCKNGISSGDSSSHWGDSKVRVVHAATRRLRCKTMLGLRGKLGEVEIDETFIGGKARNMHKSTKPRSSVVRAAVKSVRLVFMECWNVAERYAPKSSKTLARERSKTTSRESRSGPQFSPMN